MEIKAESAKRLWGPILTHPQFYVIKESEHSAKMLSDMSTLLFWGEISAPGQDQPVQELPFYP